MCRCLERTCYAKCRKAQTQVPVLRRLPLRITRCFALDDWLLEPVGPREARELLELVESRYRNGSMIICSQYGPSGWHERISEGALADAVIDRLVYNSRMIHLRGKESMRKRMAELEK